MIFDTNQERNFTNGNHFVLVPHSFTTRCGSYQLLTLLQFLILLLCIGCKLLYTDEYSLVQISHTVHQVASFFYTLSQAHVEALDHIFG